MFFVHAPYVDGICITYKVDLGMGLFGFFFLAPEKNWFANNFPGKMGLSQMMTPVTP